MDSTQVISYANKIQQLITTAQRCHSGMDQAIVGISGYWTDLGSDEFTRNCREWSNQMKELERTLNTITRSMQSYASQLNAEEQRRAAAQAKSGTKSK